MLKKHLFLASLALGLSLSSPAQNNRNQFSAAEVTADLAYLNTSLERAHFNLYAYTTSEEFRQHYRQLQASVGTDSLSLLEATNLLQQLISRANTGHAEIDFPAQAYIQYAMQGGTLFPLELAVEGGEVLLRRNFSADTTLKTGARVLSINGQKIEAVLADLYPQLSAERVYLKNAKLEFWSFPRLYWQVFGSQQAFQLGLKGEEGTRALTLSPISVMEYEGNRKGEILDQPRSLAFLKGDIAYLKPGAFSGEGEQGETKYRQFIDSAFAAVQQQQSKTLFIDLRNNPGGHNAYSDYLVAYFAHKPFSWQSRFSLKSSSILKEQTRRYQDTTDAYFKAILLHADGEVYPWTYEPYLPQDKPKRFMGKVYVLINRQTYSMAAVTAAMLQDYGFATLAGEETGDLPTLYASQFSYPLPHTGIVVKVPKGYMVRPNGSEKLEGVLPDIRIQDHLLDEEDEILQGLLDRIQKEKGRKGRAR